MHDLFVAGMSSWITGALVLGWSEWRDGWRFSLLHAFEIVIWPISLPGSHVREFIEGRLRR